jgi:hypothetical protein
MDDKQLSIVLVAGPTADAGVGVLGVDGSRAVPAPYVRVAADAHQEAVTADAEEDDGAVP